MSKELITSIDLRRNNYVKQGVVEVINSTAAYCYTPKKGQSIAQKLCGNYYNFEDIEPLLITDYILTAFGFKNNGVGWHSPNDKLYFLNNELTMVTGDFSWIVTSVHKLQNIYYELYNEWLS